MVLKIGAARIITNWGRILKINAATTNRGRFITNQDSYYKSGLLLQIGAQHTILPFLWNELEWTSLWYNFSSTKMAKNKRYKCIIPRRKTWKCHFLALMVWQNFFINDIPRSNQWIILTTSLQKISKKVKKKKVKPICCGVWLGFLIYTGFSDLTRCTLMLRRA